MRSYMHRNSSIHAPTLTPEALAIYKAIRKGVLVRIADSHWTPADLDTVAERLRCDQVAFALREMGIAAQVTESPDALTSVAPLYVSACVCIAEPHGGALHAFDAEAGKRVLQRLEAKLSLREAIDRTLEQCERPTLSNHAIGELDREAEAAQRRFNHAALRR